MKLAATGALLIAGVSILALAPAAAQASSIVYVKAGNVWVAAPNGKAQRRLTGDGTRSAPYRSPTQADNGTIVVARGHLLARMNRQSRRLNAPFAVREDRPLMGSAQKTPLEPAVSPDGTKVAYSFASTCYRSGSYEPCFRTQVTRSDRFTPGTAFGGGLIEWIYASWMDNRRLFLTYAATAGYWDLGGGPVRTWWVDSDNNPAWDPLRASLGDGDVTRAGDKIALVNGMALNRIYVYARSGPPAVPAPKCQISVPGRVDDPTWSPDGRELAYSDAKGIWVAPIPSLAGSPDCASIVPRLVIPGGSQPDWGPAG